MSKAHKEAKPPKRLQKEVIDACNFAAMQAGINQSEFFSVIYHESYGLPKNKSSTGCLGLGQFSEGAWNDVKGYKFDFDGKQQTIVEHFAKVKIGEKTIKPNWNDRTDIYSNAIASAFFAKHNMEELGTQKIVGGYLAHNLGLGGARDFYNHLKTHPDVRIDQAYNNVPSRYELNPINFTKNGEFLTFREAYANMRDLLTSRYEEAHNKGYYCGERPQPAQLVQETLPTQLGTPDTTLFPSPTGKSQPLSSNTITDPAQLAQIVADLRAANITGASTTASSKPVVDNSLFLRPHDVGNFLFHHDVKAPNGLSFEVDKNNVVHVIHNKKDIALVTGAEIRTEGSGILIKGGQITFFSSLDGMQCKNTVPLNKLLSPTDVASLSPSNIPRATQALYHQSPSP